MYKNCMDTTVTINYKMFGNVEFTAIRALAYFLNNSRLVIVWEDGGLDIVRNPEDLYTSIIFEDGTIWEFEK